MIGTFDPRSPLRAILATSRDETISASIAGDAEDAKGGDGSAPFGHLRLSAKIEGLCGQSPTRKSEMDSNLYGAFPVKSGFEFAVPSDGAVPKHE